MTSRSMHCTSKVGTQAQEGERRDAREQAARQEIILEGAPAFKIDGHLDNRYDGLYWPAEDWQQGHFVSKDGMHVYYYENNRYRCWSIDYRSQSPSNLKDWYTGGWIDLTKLPTHQSKRLPPLGLVWLEYGENSSPVGFVRILHPDDEGPRFSLPCSLPPCLGTTRSIRSRSRTYACPEPVCVKHLRANKPQVAAECYELLAVKTNNSKLRSSGLKALEELQGSSVASVLEGCLFMTQMKKPPQRQGTVAFEDQSLFLTAEQHHTPFNAGEEHWPDLPTVQISSPVCAARDVVISEARDFVNAEVASSTESDDWGVETASFCSEEEEELLSVCSDTTVEEGEWVLSGVLRALPHPPVPLLPDDQPVRSRPCHPCCAERSGQGSAISESGSGEEEATIAEDQSILIKKGRRGSELGQERKGWGRKGARARQVRRLRKQRGVTEVLAEREEAWCGRLVVQTEAGGAWLVPTRRGRRNPFAAQELFAIHTIRALAPVPELEDDQLVEQTAFPTVACPLVPVG